MNIYDGIVLREGALRWKTSLFSVICATYGSKFGRSHDRRILNFVFVHLYLPKTTSLVDTVNYYYIFNIGSTSTDHKKIYTRGRIP